MNFGEPRWFPRIPRILKCRRLNTDAQRSSSSRQPDSSLLERFAQTCRSKSRVTWRFRLRRNARRDRASSVYFVVSFAPFRDLVCIDYDGCCATNKLLARPRGVLCIPKWTTGTMTAQWWDFVCERRTRIPLLPEAGIKRMSGWFQMHPA
jgi:hypothetical protein